MANTLVTPTWVTNEVGLFFLNSVKGVANFNRSYDDQYRQAGARVGQTVKARLPQRWAVTDGQAFQEQALLDQTVDITLTNQKNVHFGWSSQQATTDLDDVRTRYVQPGAEALANAADVLGLNAVYRDVYNAVGTLGTTPSAALTYLQAGVKLSDGSTPDDGRVAVLDTLAMATIANASAALFHPAGKVTDNWTRGQKSADELGIDKWFQDQNVPKFTSGAVTVASTPLVNGAGQTGSSIITDGWGSGGAALKKGDIITLGGVYSVNPLSYASTGRLQQFVVTADISDTTGDMTIPISPSIITSGSLQTVTASPANNAVVTYWSMAAGSTLAATVSPQSLVFHRDAFAFVMADLVMPNGGARATFVRSKQWGISIRYIEQYAATSDQNLNRLDILIGAATLQARLACRVVG